METGEKTSGALFGSIVIIMILVLGGIFIFYTKMQEIKNTPKNNQDITPVEQTVK